MVLHLGSSVPRPSVCLTRRSTRARVGNFCANSCLLFELTGTAILPRVPPDGSRRFPRAVGEMLINLLPVFFAVLNSTGCVAAYLRYFDAHRRVLEAFWHKCVLDLVGALFRYVV